MTGISALILLYVLSGIATYWFVWDSSRQRRVKFRPKYALVASVLWIPFFIYLAVVGFRKEF
jgi:hypothetical protein